jgi:hypothetical protein
MIIRSVMVFVLLCMLRFPGFTQAIENTQSLEFRYGKTFSVGDYAALRYRHTTSTSIDASLAVFINGLRRGAIRFWGYGVDLLGEYYTAVGDNTDHLFELKVGLGATANIDNDPWVYKDLPMLSRLNYGIAAELSGELRLSENISLTSFLQQKILFNKNLGRFSFTLGLGFKINLD